VRKLTGMEPVSREHAEAVLALCVKRYECQINGFTIPADEHGPETKIPGLGPDDHPKLVENFRNSGHWAIVWEAGDFEWAYRFCMGDINEEIAGLMVDEGVGKQEAGRAAYEPPVDLGALLGKVHLEPYFTYAVGIYPA